MNNEKNNMEKYILGMIAETQVHVGAGDSSGFVDLPFSRESTTSYPVIHGSSIKGAFREMFESYNNNKDSIIKKMFGDDDEGAGNIVFSDARILLLPVRSLTSQYKWVTCPYIIERLSRDIERLKIPSLGKIEVPTNVEKGTALGQGEKLFLEERLITIKNKIPEEFLNYVKILIKNEKIKKRLDSQLIILSDDDFKWFAQYGLQVNARNILDQNKISQNLWYEETIPVDSVFYTLIFNRYPNESMEAFIKFIKENPYFRVGGNETIGQGWFNINVNP
ncbi:MAG: type III-B CRISPR module RAMP protein Cmr4 [Thermoplasmata archaeon]